jgi:hypothetical protein
MSIAKQYQPSLVRRVQHVTHGLTLDVYRRNGEFWNSVSETRRVWNLTDPIPRKVPPPLPQPLLPASGQFHHPPDARPWESTSPELLRRWSAFFDFCEEWLDAFRPMSDTNFPHVFLSGCLRFDPPHDSLIEFANHADNLLGRWHPVAVDNDPPPGLPITWVPDPDELAFASVQEADESADEFVRELKVALIAELDALGLDGHTLWTNAEASTLRGRASLEMGYGLPTEDALDRFSWTDRVWAASTPLIEVHPETTEADVRAASQWIKLRQPTPVPSTKSPRDPLLSLQCAIWRDEFDWSEKQIGDHFGWTIQYPPGAKPRCETARQHIAEGRALRSRQAS